MFSQRTKVQLNATVLFAMYFHLLQIASGEIPVIACPEYFRYYSDGTGYFGKITLPNIPAGNNTRLEVHLSQKGNVPETDPSSLSLYESQQETANNILSGKPITYRVEFPIHNVLPKLTLLSVNDAVICSDQDYPAPSTKIKLIQKLVMTTRTSITPFNVRENSLAGEMANAVQTTTTTKKPPQFSGNPFLWKNANSEQPMISSNTKPINVFKANPNNIFLYQPKSTEGTSTLNEVCGRESATITPFIRGGTTISRGQFPWLTAIYRKHGTDLKFICGGSLISARTVISAAHCFLEHRLQANKVLVLLGRNNLEAIEEEGSEHRALQSLLLHPEYNADAISDADIALLKFQTPVTFTRYISPICLWNTNTDIANIAGQTAFVAGWGADENGESVTRQPKKIETRIADDGACKRSLQDYQTMISSRTICVSGNSNVGPCTGDSGGGLVIHSNDHWTLRGIVSAGLTRQGKCFSHEYYYFCDIGKHMNWIQQNMLL